MGRFTWERLMMVSSLPFPTRSILLTLAIFMDGDDGGDARPGLDNLVQVSRGRSVVIEHLNAAVAAGYLIVVERGGWRRTPGGPGVGRATEYAASVPAAVYANREAILGSKPWRRERDAPLTSKQPDLGHNDEHRTSRTLDTRMSEQPDVRQHDEGPSSRTFVSYEGPVLGDEGPVLGHERPATRTPSNTSTKHPHHPQAAPSKRSAFAGLGATEEEEKIIIEKVKTEHNPKALAPYLAKLYETGDLADMIDQHRVEQAKAAANAYTGPTHPFEPDHNGITCARPGCLRPEKNRVHRVPNGTAAPTPPVPAVKASPRQRSDDDTPELSEAERKAAWEEGQRQWREEKAVTEAQEAEAWTAQAAQKARTPGPRPVPPPAVPVTPTSGTEGEVAVNTTAAANTRIAPVTPRAPAEASPRQHANDETRDTPKTDERPTSRDLDAVIGDLEAAKAVNHAPDRKPAGQASSRTYTEADWQRARGRAAEFVIAETSASKSEAKAAVRRIEDEGNFDRPYRLGMRVHELAENGELHAWLNPRSARAAKASA
ncbi:hypothetical protein AB0K00_20710 [Dactylosporangium sp. NPDC049525]|uniref:hypothetical protein n=1 Tax=Dactylosporangium sp. NPDC049525 TaxID=3154730 RepID=UPI0034218369